MPRRIQLSNSSDFTGGLNLSRDAFQLDDDESPELLNVDIDPRGGFRLRRAVAPFHPTALAGDVKKLWSYVTPAGTPTILAQVGDTVLWTASGDLTSVGTLGAAGGTFRAATFNANNYVVRNAAAGSFRWDGTVVSSMGDDWNNDLAGAGPDQNVPRAKLVASHKGYLWVANTSEDGTAYPNRVRFSHPNKPERWADYQYFDIEPSAADEITALVPFGDRLLVFKRRSIFAIHGYSASTLQVQPITLEIGAISQEAVVATDEGVYFFSWPDGVFLLDSKGTEWVWERLYPAITDGLITHTASAQVQLGWGNRRLWVAVPYNGSSTRNRVFVLDPQLGKHGSWTLYDLAVGPFLEWSPSGQLAQFLAGGVGRNRILKLDQEAAADNYGAAGVHISSLYRTRFYDIDSPAVKKRWRRPELVMKGGTTATLRVEVFRDYDASEPVREFLVGTTGEGAAGLWDALSWDSGLWGSGGAAADRNEVKRGSPLGNGRSVALKFNGPTSDVDWGVDSITLKHIPKAVRS